MGKVEKRTLTPRLRFPEFRKGERWYTDSVGSKTVSFAGGTPDTSTKEFYGGIIPFIRSAEIGRESTELTLTEKGLNSSAAKLITRGDVLVALYGANSGDVAVAKIDGAINQAILCLRSADNNWFLYHYLNARKDWIIATFLQGGQGNLSGDIIKSVVLGFPSKAEQQKIADCLTSLDELIAAQGRKVDTLKSHKKGLMQELFPREGETVPRLRFREFRDGPEWEEKRLDAIGRVIRGSSPRPQGDSRYYGGPVPRLMVQDVTRDGKWVTPRIDSLTEEGAKLSRPCPAGTLTIVCSGNVGVVSFLAVNACIHDGFLALIDVDESIVTKDFLYHSLSTLRQQFEKGATHGGVFTNLTTSAINAFMITCPSVPEQTKIADCLSSLDSRIDAETEKLDALKTHKKGLMQHLFPSPESV